MEVIQKDGGVEDRRERGREGIRMNKKVVVLGYFKHFECPRTSS